MKTKSLLLVAWVLCTFVGCKPSEKQIAVVKVTGQLFTAEKKPATGATVAFHPIGREAYPFTPFGTVGRDGTFTLTSYASGDGAPAGEYAVTIVWRSNDPDGEAMGPDKLKGKDYNDPKTTPFKAVVGVTETTLEPFYLK